tara:strand:+ start:1225 stop:1710 length:486 start_codon:yes stop_codon:yes gene_type:complete
LSNNQILIVLNGEDQSILTINSNKIILANKKLDNIYQDHTLLQTNFESLEDFIKAEAIIKSQFSKIDELIIINKDIDLNMISYQYDYNHIKKNYQVLINIIYFINLLVPLFNQKLTFILSLEKDNHYKIHLNNFKVSLINYLNSLKKDLVKSNNIIIKKLD